MYSTCTVQLEVLAAWSHSPKTRHDQHSTSGCPRVGLRKSLVCLILLSSHAVFRFHSPTRPRPGCPHNAHVQVVIPDNDLVILDNDRSLSRITTWAFLKECKMASTAALQVQVHEAGGVQRRQAGTAFADLLSAMEALPEALLA